MTQVRQIRPREDSSNEAAKAIEEAASEIIQLVPNSIELAEQELAQHVKKVCDDALKELGETAHRTQKLMEAIIKRRTALIEEIANYARDVDAAVVHNKVVQESLTRLTNSFPEVKPISGN